MRLKRQFLRVCILLTMLASPALAGTEYVDKNNTTGIEDGTVEHPYSTVQGAVNVASAGDTVVVLGGLFIENIDIIVPLTLQSDGSATIKAANASLPVITVKSNDVVVNGFVLEGPYTSGIEASNVQNCVFSNNSITVANYWVEGWGLKLSGINNCVISDNILDGNWGGISFSGENNVIGNNVIKNTFSPRYFYGIIVGRGTGNTLTGNMISGVRGNAIEIGLGANNNTIIENNIAYNWYAMGGDGLYYGGATIGNKIYHNNFISNSLQLASYPYAQWDNGYEGGGNYWSDWTGPDVNFDKIVDQPKDRDFYPVTEPYGWKNISYSSLEKSIHNLMLHRDYATITEALLEAGSGDLIKVDGGSITGKGRYYDNANITVPLTLQSDGGATIKAANASLPVITVKSNDVIVNGFVLEGPYTAGIEASNVQNCVFSNNSITEVVPNIRDESWGIKLSGIKNCVISGDTLDGNWGSISFSGENNVIGNNVIKNTFSPRHFYGVVVGRGTGNTLTGNLISGVGGNAIEIGWGANNNTITENNIAYNWYAMGGDGLYYGGATIGNKIYHNNFISNSLQLASYAYAQWDNGYPAGGNYWSNWTTPDDFSGPYQDATSADGIVDKPYGYDQYPLVRANGWIPQNTPPIANAGPDIKVYPGEKFTLDATASYDAEGSIAIYSWNLGGENFYTETQVSAPDGAFDGKTLYSYNQPASYTVTLTVTDSAGASASDIAVVTVMSISDGINSIASLISGINLSKGSENALLAKLVTAKEALNNGDAATAKVSLQDLINQITATGFAKNKLPDGFADTITPEIKRMINLL